MPLKSSCSRSLSAFGHQYPLKHVDQDKILLPLKGSVGHVLGARVLTWDAEIPKAVSSGLVEATKALIKGRCVSCC